jgi:acyl dehydratase
VLPTLVVTNQALLALVGINRPEDYPGFHGEHWIECLSVLTPGMVVNVEATVVGVRATPGGTTIVIETQTNDSAGRLVNRQYFTSILPHTQHEVEYGVYSPMKRLRPKEAAGWMSSQATYLPVDLAERYADVSGDHHPYHLDPRAARAAGLSGTILHGVCAMAVASTVIVETVCAGDPSRLGGLGVRFAKPITCGQTVRTRISRVSENEAGPAGTFEMLDQADEVVLKNGLVLVRDQ